MKLQLVLAICSAQHYFSRLKLQNFCTYLNFASQGLRQDLETGCLKLAVVKFLGVQIFKGDHNILRFQPQTCINSSI